eukprot:TRINITY_DN750_c0_g1_i8.p1 TRINITY_DN750_c0_g1~~TRINITY_DN750_c0_g1_i8.p1  ORF type:complete len:687 (-),score=145.29 TRINITY_DN750_c0_g1_i8:298-2319(-)
MDDHNSNKRVPDLNDDNPSPSKRHSPAPSPDLHQAEVRVKVEMEAGVRAQVEAEMRARLEAEVRAKVEAEMQARDVKYHKLEQEKKVLEEQLNIWQNLGWTYREWRNCAWQHVQKSKDEDLASLRTSQRMFLKETPKEFPADKCHTGFAKAFTGQGKTGMEAIALVGACRLQSRPVERTLIVGPLCATVDNVVEKLANRDSAEPQFLVDKLHLAPGFVRQMVMHVHSLNQFDKENSWVIYTTWQALVKHVNKNPDFVNEFSELIVDEGDFGTSAIKIRKNEFGTSVSCRSRKDSGVTHWSTILAKFRQTTHVLLLSATLYDYSIDIPQPYMDFNYARALEDNTTKRIHVVFLKYKRPLHAKGESEISEKDTLKCSMFHVTCIKPFLKEGIKTLCKYREMRKEFVPQMHVVVPYAGPLREKGQIETKPEKKDQIATQEEPFIELLTQAMRDVIREVAPEIALEQAPRASEVERKAIEERVQKLAVSCIYDKLSKAEVSKRLKAFSRKSTDIMLTFGMFGRSFDAPSISVTLDLRKFGSFPSYLQCPVGRGARVVEKCPSAEAWILENAYLGNMRFVERLCKENQANLDVDNVDVDGPGCPVDVPIVDEALMDQVAAAGDCSSDSAAAAAAVGANSNTGSLWRFTDLEVGVAEAFYIDGNCPGNTARELPYSREV